MKFLRSHLKDIASLAIIILVAILQYYKVEGIPDDVMALATGLFFGNRLGSKNHQA